MCCRDDTVLMGEQVFVSESAKSPSSCMNGSLFVLMYVDVLR